MIYQTYWNFFKESPKGQACIQLFKRAQERDFTPDEAIKLCKPIAPQYFSNWGKKNYDIFCHNYEFSKFLVEQVSHRVTPEMDADEIYAIAEEEFLKTEEKRTPIENMAFKILLNCNMPLSLALYARFPNIFLPNLFTMQFACLQRFADKHEIEVPRVPVSRNYKDRCRYYLEACKALWDFARQYNFTNPEELCAYIYGLELQAVKEDIERSKNRAMPELPAQAWFIGGKYSDGEKDMTYGFWQANQMTSRGDILVFYEKAPVMALNAIYIAQEDGVVDPFFSYYSHTYIGGKIDLPAIKLEELQKHPYFKEHSLVKKNFQGVNGWHISTEDYDQLLSILESKGVNIDSLPKLYQPGNIVVPENLENEAAVSKYLICELLGKMGWELWKDYTPEVHFPAGHGETGMKMDKRPDFCLHMYKVNDKPRAKVIIESKFNLSEDEQLRKAFDQTETYASWGHARVMLICDKNQIKVYERTHHGEFSKDHKVTYRWKALSNNDKFQELKYKLREID